MKRIAIILGVLLGTCSLALAQGAGTAGGGSASGGASAGSSTSAGSAGSTTTGNSSRATPSNPSSSSAVTPAPGGYNPTSPTGNTDTGVFKK
jgi:hypothetical protein